MLNGAYVREMSTPPTVLVSMALLYLYLYTSFKLSDVTVNLVACLSCRLVDLLAL